MSLQVPDFLKKQQPTPRQVQECKDEVAQFRTNPLTSRDWIIVKPPKAPDLSQFPQATQLISAQDQEGVVDVKFTVQQQ